MLFFSYVSMLSETKNIIKTPFIFKLKKITKYKRNTTNKKSPIYTNAESQIHCIEIIAFLYRSVTMFDNKFDAINLKLRLKIANFYFLYRNTRS